MLYSEFRHYSGIQRIVLRCKKKPRNIALRAKKVCEKGIKFNAWENKRGPSPLKLCWICFVDIGEAAVVFRMADNGSIS